MKNRFRRVFDKVSLDSAERNSIIENVVNNQRVEREGRHFWQTNAGGIVMGCAALVVFVLINAAIFGGMNKGAATPMAAPGPEDYPPEEEFRPMEEPKHVFVVNTDEVLLEAWIDVAVLKGNGTSLEGFIKEFMTMQGTWSEDAAIWIDGNSAEQESADTSDVKYEIPPEEEFKPMEEPVHVLVANSEREFLEVWVDLAVLKTEDTSVEEFIKEYLLVKELWSEDVTITIADEMPESETSAVQEETVSEVETTPAQETAADSDMDVLDITKEEQEALFAQTAQHLPVKNAVMTAIMAVRDDNKYQHNGIDLTSDDTTVYAILDGTVTDYGYTAQKGNYLVIDNGNGVVTEYAHLSESLVSVGDVLSAGTPAAVMGKTGMSTGIHLHWEMTVNGELVNPLCYVAEYLK